MCTTFKNVLNINIDELKELGINDTSLHIKVEAGYQVLKYASMQDNGVKLLTKFTGTKNTQLKRNKVTWGLWSNHGAQVIVDVIEMKDDS